MPPVARVKVGFITLGCDKNTVDSERYLALLADHGGELAPDLDDADVIIINTCGFIDAAKQESIDAIVDAGRRKSDGSCQTVVAVGCMVERHKSELEAELPEVDLFLGASEMERLVPELLARGVLDPDAPLVAHPGVRLYTGDLPHVRYLKVSEGCDHGCAFCAIPLMRGRHRSFALDDIIREAQLLELQGAREINLVAQDLAHYGRDRRDGIALPELLAELCESTSIPWLRLLYLYPTGITPKLLELMAREPRVLPYLDMPIQHGSDAVLARMRRPERARTIRERVARLRDAVPGRRDPHHVHRRLPGRDARTTSRCSAISSRRSRFERVGAFTYSPQEGTSGALLEDDVPMPVKRDRLERLTDLQRAITAERYERHIGSTVRAIVDRVDRDTGERTGRTLWQADDIDGIVRLCRQRGGPDRSSIA